ncbi:hypothetical protein FFT09_17085 [Saccharomonospora piscinae]|uniref:hypothetical protein n=1 Tax=Saccharomonospora piscinae TaxID=687388 RepID=UPI0011060F2C|nr:hypothetical protein [Saccharomonospora piscinae]TLW90992.1 hypothetical protein FFT09_17085 [Saccharomonospora piscinae]
MSLGAGLFVVLAVAASAAGWWSLAAPVLAGALAWVVWRGPLTERGRVGAALAGATQWALLAVSAVVAATYLVPGSASTGAAGPVFAVVALVVVAVAVAADAAGARVGDRIPRWYAVLLGLAAVAFVAVCVAIAPAGDVADAGTGALPPPGLVVAVLVYLPLVAELRGWRLIVGVAAAVTVAGAALYQVGPVRLGLSAASLRDVLAAADATALTPMLVAVAALAGTASAVRCAGRLRRASGRPGWSASALAAAGAAGVAAAVLGPQPVLLLAGAVALADSAHAVGQRVAR